MENEGMINCPNCNKRTFSDNKECIYCKYILKEENNFDKNIYNFLYNEYIKSKNKPETIKIGMEKFNMNMTDIKEIVDYIAEQIYHNIEAQKKVEHENQYSQLKTELTKNYGVYKFSIIQYFLHEFLPKSIVIMLLIFLAIQIYKYIPKLEIIIYQLILISFIIFSITIRRFTRQISQEFTINSVTVEYEKEVYSDSVRNIHRYTKEKYVIHSIKEVKETISSIIIYGDIRKSYIESYNTVGTNNHVGPKVNKLKLTKSFRNNRNLIKSLKILSEIKYQR